MVDWALAIRRNGEALERVLAVLFALVGLPGDAPASGSQSSTLPRHLHAHALRILRAAEAAIRRLIVIAARDVTVHLRHGGKGVRRDLAFLRKGRRQAPAGRRQGFGEEPEDETNAPGRIPAFPLLDPLRKLSFDPPRRASKFFPRICVVGVSEPAPIPEKPVLLPDDPVSAEGLYRRLLSSRRALADLPREARRLARWQARNRLRLGQGRRGRVLPLRLGRPPGGRKRPVHPVDDILKECHALALDAMSPPDTS